MKSECIADTSAVEGDRVRCVKVLGTGMPGRFVVGQVYSVFREGRQLKVHGNLKGPREIPGGKVAWDVPMSWVGYGYLWEKVAA